LCSSHGCVTVTSLLGAVMTGNNELLNAIEAFLQAPKTIVGVGEPFNWVAGYNQYEKRAVFPLEVAGELPPPARLEIVGFPQMAGQFRITLCYNAAICRLDHTAEAPHINSEAIQEDEVPYSVEGHHIHPWSKNRRFFKGASIAPRLHNAIPFVSQGSFDSNLRWFCAQHNIEQPPRGHLIALPARDILI
jgi:hypothetical protein